MYRIHIQYDCVHYVESGRSMVLFVFPLSDRLSHTQGTYGHELWCITELSHRKTRQEIYKKSALSSADALGSGAEPGVGACHLCIFANLRRMAAFGASIWEIRLIAFTLKIRQKNSEVNPITYRVVMSAMFPTAVVIVLGGRGHRASLLLPERALRRPSP